MKLICYREFQDKQSESMISDIETGLKYFSRICVNIMVENQMPIKTDKRLLNSLWNMFIPCTKIMIG